MPNIIIEISGPFFSPGADIITAAFIKRAEERVAQDAEEQVRTFEHQFFQNPTGYYERHLTTRVAADHHLVTDSGVIYGPWLEGTGSRNAPVTRFKGYAIFRRTTQVVNRRATRLANPVIRDLCKVLNA